MHHLGKMALMIDDYSGWMASGVCDRRAGTSAVSGRPSFACFRNALPASPGSPVAGSGCQVSLRRGWSRWLWPSSAAAPTLHFFTFAQNAGNVALLAFLAAAGDRLKSAGQLNGAQEMAERVLIIDDDTRLSAMLADYLGKRLHRPHRGSDDCGPHRCRPPCAGRRDSRCHAAGPGRLRDLPAHARGIRRTDPDAQGQRRRDRSHRRAGTRSRRLFTQTFQSARIAGAAEGDPAPPQR